MMLTNRPTIRDHTLGELSLCEGGGFTIDLHFPELSKLERHRLFVDCLLEHLPPIKQKEMLEIFYRSATYRDIQPLLLFARIQLPTFEMSFDLLRYILMQSTNTVISLPSDESQVLEELKKRLLTNFHVSELPTLKIVSYEQHASPLVDKFYFVGEEVWVGFGESVKRKKGIVKQKLDDYYYEILLHESNEEVVVHFTRMRSILKLGKGTPCLEVYF